MNNLAQKLAWVFAASFIIAFAIPFIPNPLVGNGAVFQTNLAHDLVHLLTAIGFVAVALIGAKASVLYMKAFGFVYLAVAILGFIVLGSATDTHLLGLIHINAADNFLHLGLAAVIIAAGFFAASSNASLVSD
jgi:Domain of unknown function (DUF4383)